jgi:hypothetical protein
VLVPTEAVGAVGTPVKAALLIVGLVFKTVDPVPVEVVTPVPPEVTGSAVPKANEGL